MSDDVCGAETQAGTPCQNPAGSCPHHDSTQSSTVGRPSKLTYERQERIAQALEQGASFKAACEASGIHRDTGHRWLRKGEEQDEGEYSDFYDRVTRARGIGKLDLANSIVQIAKQEQDARTLLKYLQHIEGGESSDDEELAGLNLVVPEIAKQDE